MIDRRMQLEFEERLRSDCFPCVGAKSALARGNIEYFEADRIESPASDLPLYKAICSFNEKLDVDSPVVQSFVTLFSHPSKLDEKAFEAALWNRLQCLHNIDAAAGQEWARDVAADPNSPHFSLSIGGTAYFVIGLHPCASRAARRFAHPVLVFNSHQQFEQLRSDGRYEQMKQIIRKRDISLNGGINPMLDDHGDASEARQYSGRLLEAGWKCPFAKQQPLTAPKEDEAQAHE